MVLKINKTVENKKLYVALQVWKFHIETEMVDYFWIIQETNFSNNENLDVLIENAIKKSHDHWLLK